MTVTRRLAAILAADLAGYSRLMGADKEGMHGRLKGHFPTLFQAIAGRREDCSCGSRAG